MLECLNTYILLALIKLWCWLVFGVFFGDILNIDRPWWSIRIPSLFRSSSGRYQHEETVREEQRFVPIFRKRRSRQFWSRATIAPFQPLRRITIQCKVITLVCEIFLNSCKHSPLTSAVFPHRNTFFNTACLRAPGLRLHLGLGGLDLSLSRIRIHTLCAHVSLSR